jgi:RND family efflux transporter MFP subunit
MGIANLRTIAGIVLMLGSATALRAQGAAPAAAPWQVTEHEIDDLKAVFATVRSKDRIEARVRTPGTVVTLKVAEGAHVEAGQVLALIADPKIALGIKALDARIVGIESRLTNATVELERAEQLRTRGVTPQARVDQLKTTFDVATNELKAARADRLVADQQVSEGEVLAPAAGRILKVPVTEGSVVMGGESIATIAANQYVLRLELPERHARFMKVGDAVRIGARGLGANEQAMSEGRITMVYPELQGGRVLADAEIAGLGDYFVGERARVWISAGKRRTIVIPADFVFKRFGLDYVRLSRGNVTADVVVQLGEGASLPDKASGIEILAGLRAGDAIVRLAVQP